MSRKRTHSRAKDSIAAGIGLWETSSSASLVSPDEESERTPSEAGGGDESVPSEKRASMEESLRELVPILKVRSRGSGQVSGLVVVSDVEYADPTEGDALLVLRRDGCARVTVRDFRS